MHADITKSDYIAALQVLHCFHATYSRLVIDLVQDLSDSSVLAPSSAAKLIAGDLGWLGAKVPQVSPTLVDPPCCRLDALGALYVMEGSLLGGRVIGRHVALNLGVGPHAGGDFFCSSAAETARARWRAFCALLERSVPDEDAIECVCIAASAAFMTLELWLRTPIVPSMRAARIAA
jgi:heme oxygenase